MFDAINQYFFTLINAPAGTREPVIYAATIAAEAPVFLVAALMIIGWILGGKPTRRALFNAGLAVIIGLAINLIIQSIWFHPLPAVAGFGQQSLANAADASFPSDHGTLMFSVTLALLLSKSRLGYAALVATLITAWARIFIGVHWPFDMLASVFVALLAALLVSRLLLGPLTPLFNAAQTLYRRLLNALHLPTKFFPR